MRPVHHRDELGGTLTLRLKAPYEGSYIESLLWCIELGHWGSAGPEIFEAFDSHRVFSLMLEYPSFGLESSTGALSRFVNQYRSVTVEKHTKDPQKLSPLTVRVSRSNANSGRTEIRNWRWKLTYTLWVHNILPPFPHTIEEIPIKILQQKLVNNAMTLNGQSQMFRRH